MAGPMRWAALLLALALPGLAPAQAPANSGIVVADFAGALRYRIGDSPPLVVTKGQTLPVGARLTTAADSYAVLTFADGQVVAIGQQSRLLLREYSFSPSDPARGRVLLNLTDGSMFVAMGAIGQRDPGLIQIQVGTKITPQSPRRARGNDAGVIVLGIATMIQVTQGRVSLLVASTDQSLPLAAGARALVQADGMVRTGPPGQVDEQAGRSEDGKVMLARLDAVRRHLPSGRQIAFSISTPPSDETDEEFVFATPLLPTASTGGGGGGRPCGASCN